MVYEREFKVHVEIFTGYGHRIRNDVLEGR
jgi:hypothetical protein